RRVLLNRTAIKAIILVGFRGYYNAADPNDPWNEELVPTLNDLINSGFNEIFMAVHEKQAAKRNEPTSGLMAERFASGKAVSYADAGGFMRELLWRHSSR